MIGSLTLPDELRGRISEEARAAYPRECCGLVEGIIKNGCAIVTNTFPARNVSTHDDEFEIDPADHARTRRAARAAGHTIIGCYHSHPDAPAELSARDLERANEQGFLWLIVSVEHARTIEMVAYRYTGDGFEPLEMCEFALA